MERERCSTSVGMPSRHVLKPRSRHIAVKDHPPGHWLVEDDVLVIVRCDCGGYPVIHPLQVSAACRVTKKERETDSERERERARACVSERDGGEDEREGG